MTFRLLLCLCLGLLASHCSSSRGPTSALHELNDDNYWDYFVSTWQDPSYHGYIKFSMEINEAGQPTAIIYHPNTYKYHAEHLVTLPAYAGLSSAQLDSITLYNKGRRLLLGTMLIPKSVEDYAHPTIADIQLMGKDPIQPELVAAVFRFFTQDLSYLPVAEQLNFIEQERGRFLALGIKFASVHTDQTRICYNAGWGVGHVRIVPQGALEGFLAAGAITADDILVMDEVPRELPVVAGIVVSQTSSPSSHPALLAGMLGIPFVYEKDATALESWKALAQASSPVFFQASGDATGTCQFLIRSGAALTSNEAATLSTLKKPLPLNMNDYDHSATSPISLDQLSRSDADKVGAKAANVAELRRIIPTHTVKEGLALPVGLFAEALATAQTKDGRALRTVLDQELQKLLSPAISSKETAEGLARMRELIEKAKLNPATSAKITQAINATFPAGTRIKLRSSSNIEDHPEFNGAGLYESKGADAGDDSVIKSAQKVWASLYSLKAWVARRYYGVDEQRTGMGILVQPSYKGELANGVAISGFPAYNNGDEPRIEVQSTGFPGEDLEVTNPPVGKIPETTLISSHSIEVQIASTEVPRGRMLLTEDLYRQLYEQMAIVHAHYLKALNPKDQSQFKLDMEWKLIVDGGVQKIVIKQVRPVPMKISSTQGLDRGTMLIGERQAKLCPSPMESSSARMKLALSTAMPLSVALQEIPADDRTSIPNPIEQIEAFGKTVALAATANVSYTAWDKLWGTANERREYTVSIPVQVDGQTYQLQWTGRQERALAQPRLLLNSVSSIWNSDLRLRLDEENYQDYQVVVGNSACETDAWQGFLPGSAQADSVYASQRKAPIVYGETYESADGAYKVVIEGRTAFQGFDKTRFVNIDRATLNGQIVERAVYAPAHHNFVFEYGLVIQGQIWLLKTGDEFGEEGPRYRLVRINAQGQEEEISKMDQTQRTDIFNGGGGFGIGF